MKTTNALAALIPSIVYFSIFANPVCAQTENAGETEAQRRLSPITVTAQKRVENAQTVPIAITAISAEDVKQTRLTQATDILNLTPGATFTSTNPLEQLYSIRGISSGSEGASADAGVLMMIDGEVISRDFMRTAALFDVERIEVLRGPQGTTYGRNSTGGVFHVISQKPTDTFDASAQIGVGNFGLIEGQGFINGALTDTISGRLSFYTQSRDGYTEDIVRDIDIDDYSTTALRGQLSFDTGANSDVLFRAHYSSDEAGTTPRTPYDETLPYLGLFGFTFVEPSLDPYETAGSDVEGIEREIYGVSAEYNWRGEAIDLFGLAAYRYGKADFDQDIFGTDQIAIRQLGVSEATTIDLEARISNAPSADNLQWMVGLFYLNEDSSRDEIKDIFPDYLGGALATIQDFKQTNVTDSYGLFGDVVFDINEKTSIEAGLRYSYDEKDFSVFHSAVGAFSLAVLEDPSLGPVFGSPSDNWSKVTWKLSGNHEVTPNIFVYGTVGNGFKAGGFNPEPASFEALIAFDEEEVMSYEIGAKTELFDNTLRLNIAAFSSEFTDIQAEFFSPSGAAIIDNVASATINGIEIESIWQASNHLSFVFSGSAYDHEYDSFLDADGNDNAGNPIANVPDWTISAGLRADLPILPASKGDLTARLDYRTRSEISNEPFYDQVYGIRPGVDSLDARITWISPGERYELSAWGKNLLDEVEISNIGPTLTFNQTLVNYEPPLTFGVTATARFGQ